MQYITLFVPFCYAELQFFPNIQIIISNDIFSQRFASLNYILDKVFDAFVIYTDMFYLLYSKITSLHFTYDLTFNSDK